MAIASIILRKYSKEIVSLKVIFDETVENGMRSLMMTSMAKSCYYVRTLHLVGFEYSNFDFNFGGFGGPDFNKILPSVNELILYESYMPYSALVTLTTITRLSVWHPSELFLLSSNPINFANMVQLRIIFDKTPVAYHKDRKNIKNMFPINFDSVKILEISDSANSNLTADDYVALSKTWKGVEHLKIRIKTPLEMYHLRKLLKRMPAVQHIDGVIIDKSVSSSGLLSFLCSRENIRLKTFKMRYITDTECIHVRNCLMDLKDKLDKKNDCGEICISENSDELNYFRRT